MIEFFEWQISSLTSMNDISSVQERKNLSLPIVDNVKRGSVISGSVNSVSQL